MPSTSTAFGTQGPGGLIGLLKKKPTQSIASSGSQNSQNIPLQSSSGQISQGNNKGLITPTAPVTKTTDVQGNTTHYSTKSNPSVLDQQKALNKLGAGLVEDGIVGPKTREAIARYGNTSSQPAQQPVEPPKPEPLDTQSNARRVLQTGQPTQAERTATGLLYQAGQMTPEERAANEEVRRANELQKGYQNVSALSPYAEAEMFADRARTPAEMQDLLRAPDLVGRASATQGLLGTLGDIYGSSRVAGAGAALQGVQTAAQRGLTAAQGGLSGVQNQAQRAQGAASDVFGAGLPTLAQPGQIPFNPLTGQGGQILGSEGGGLFGVGAIQGQIDLGKQYPALVSAHTQAQGIEQQIDNYLAQNPSLNPSTLTDVNKISQWLISGKLGDPKYQTLANYLNEYISTLAPILGVGGDVTNLKTEIAQSFVNGAASGQSISEVLKNIDNLATQKLNAMRQTGMGSASAPVSTSQSGGSGFAEEW